MRCLVPISAAALLLLATGCMVGPNYTRPTAPTAPAFKESSEWKEGDGWKVAQPNDTALRGKWWELYGDTKLSELEEQVGLHPVVETRQKRENSVTDGTILLLGQRIGQACPSSGPRIHGSQARGPREVDL
jgi:hypothetical protein